MELSVHDVKNIYMVILLTDVQLLMWGQERTETKGDLDPEYEISLFILKPSKDIKPDWLQSSHTKLFSV